MPVYEFSCECGEEKEILVSMGTKTIKCDICGKEMRKLISQSTFHLKGSGWYVTDYGDKNVKKTKNKI
jgi:putative FmdB family regulatory protein